MTSFIDQLVEFAVRPETKMNSEQDLKWLKAMLLDWVGCAIAGAQTPPAHILLKTLPRFDEGVTAIGVDAQLDETSAALFNGTAGHALDFDDTEFVGETHPSTVIFPALLAAAERLNASLDDVLEAASVGYRILRPIGVAVNPTHYGRGWHATGTVGGLGAAAAVATLEGLSESGLTNALALVATAAAGQQSSFGTMAKPLNAGRAAREALLSVRLAQGGFSAPQNAFEGQGGFFSLLGSEQKAKKKIARELGTLSHPVDWIRIKEFPTCHCTHAALIATRSIVRRNPEKTVSSVDVALSQYAYDLVSVRNPKTQEEARFSQSYCIAAMVLIGNVDLNCLTDDCLNDTKIRALEGRVACETAPDLSQMATRVTVKFSDGMRDTEATQITAFGAADIPTGLEEKFRSNLAFSNHSLDADAIISAIQATNSQPIIRILALASRRK